MLIYLNILCEFLGHCTIKEIAAWNASRKLPTGAYKLPYLEVTISWRTLFYFLPILLLLLITLIRLHSAKIRNIAKFIQESAEHQIPTALLISPALVTRGDYSNLRISTRLMYAFRDFCVFETHTIAPRIARNPKTSERVDVPAKRKVKFRPGRLMREGFNSGAHG